MIRKVCFFGPKKKAFYANRIGFTNLKSVWTSKISLFYNPVLPYPIPSYQIPSLPHPTRILNTILHLYKILLPYTTLSYHIEIEPNRPTAETSRIGKPSKFTQAEKSRPKRPKLCCLHSQNAEIIWTGLQSHSSAKKRFFFWREFTGKSEAVHTPLKCKQSRYASKQDIIGYQENVLCT